MDDAHFLIEDGEEDDDGASEEPLDPCPRCGRAHVALFFGARYRTFQMPSQGQARGTSPNFFSQSAARVSMLTCMDCGYIELYHEEMLKQHD